VRYRVDVGGYAMHVMERGEGRPVLMVHGNPTWGFLYRKVAAELEGAALRIILPDLVGLGFSDRPKSPGEHRLDNHARWLGALLDSLASEPGGLEGLVVVMQDWGGPMMLRALADRPGLTKGLVVLNTVVGPPRLGFRPSPFHRLARLPLVSDLVFRGLGFPQNVLRLVQGDRRSIRGDVSRAYRFPLRGLGRNQAPLALARMVPDSLRHPSIEPLQRCQAFFESFPGPVEIVWGERDPVLGRLVTHLARLRPEARVTRTRAGHFLQEEVPSEIAAAVLRVAAALGPAL
jgi:haloalkane dehalogenase